MLTPFHSAQHGEPGTATAMLNSYWTVISNPDTFSQWYFKSVADFLVSIILGVSWAPSDLCQLWEALLWVSKLYYSEPTTIFAYNSVRGFSICSRRCENRACIILTTGQSAGTVNCGVCAAPRLHCMTRTTHTRTDGGNRACSTYVWVTRREVIDLLLPPSNLPLGLCYCMLLLAFWKGKN